MYKTLLLTVLSSLCIFSGAAINSAKIGEKVNTEDNELSITAIDFKHGYGKGDYYDPDISSPKSVSFHPNGKKIYVNSLEGYKTVVYDAQSRKKIKVIDHDFQSGTGGNWIPASNFYPFTHYENGETKAFKGKPVEGAFSKDGKYFFVPYYRRNFDLNAQDPSALAIIDTEKDEIVAMVETGPLPKMVKVSNDGKLLAITHWGNNTVGLLDISNKNPRNWRHLAPITIGRKLDLNYSLTKAVNRDSGSGYLLRGTVFLPGDSILLISGMAGPMAVIDVKKKEWIGMIPALGNVRHITMKNGMLYMSRNSAGEVLSIPVENVVKTISSQKANTRDFKVDGIKKAKVGSGARTIKASPSGKYLFVASNIASEIGVVRTEDMKFIGRITADSFPVGLDISPDGTLLASTSQGRKGSGGGNALDFFHVDYAEKEISTEPPFEANIDTEPNELINKEADNHQVVNNGIKTTLLWCLGIAILVLILIFLFLYGKRRKNK